MKVTHIVGPPFTEITKSFVRSFVRVFLSIYMLIGCSFLSLAGCPILHRLLAALSWFPSGRCWNFSCVGACRKRLLPPYVNISTLSSSLTSSLTSSSSLIGENAAVDLAVKQERELEKSHLKVNNNQCSSSNGEMRNGVVGVNHANLNAAGGKDLKSLAKVVTQLTAIRSKEMETKG